MQKPRRHPRFLPLVSAVICLLYLAILAIDQRSQWQSPLSPEHVSRSVERTLWIHSMLPPADAYYGRPLHWLWMPDDGSGLTRTLINAFDATESPDANSRLAAEAALTAIYRGREDIAAERLPRRHVGGQQQTFLQLTSGIVHPQDSDPQTLGKLAENHAAALGEAIADGHKPTFWDYQALVLALGEVPSDLAQAYTDRRSELLLRLIFVSALHLLPLIIGLLCLSNFLRWLRATPAKPFDPANPLPDFQPAGLLAIMATGLLAGHLLFSGIGTGSDSTLAATAGLLHQPLALLITFAAILLASRFFYQRPLPFKAIPGLQRPRNILRVQHIFPALLLCVLPAILVSELLKNLPLREALPDFPAVATLDSIWQPLHILLDLAILVVVLPLLHEVLYRGLLHRTLSTHWRRLPAILTSSLVFAATLATWTPIHFIHLFASGIVFALLYEKTKSLWPAIIIQGLIGFIFSAQTWLVYGP